MPRAAGKLTDLIRKDDPIVKYEGEGAAILKQISKPVLKITEDVAELAEQMQIIMRAANGVGLAAPQLGILQRIIVYDAGDGFHALINPKILQRKGTQVGVEGCLSIPGLQGDVERAAEVVVKAQDQFGKPVRIRGEGLAARVLQHEIDHLDGILFIDRNPQNLHYVTADEAEAEEKSGIAPQTRE
ncbi:MAG: peptide deformylase [Armatimonadetes bacterium]|nr:peptide deformylase [Armatimonadota bacterium]